MTEALHFEMAIFGIRCHLIEPAASIRGLVRRSCSPMAGKALPIKSATMRFELRSPRSTIRTTPLTLKRSPTQSPALQLTRQRHWTRVVMTPGSSTGPNTPCVSKTSRNDAGDAEL